MIRRDFLYACLAFAAGQSKAANAQECTLFAQGASAVLKRQFAEENLSWLLVGHTANVLSQNWPDAAYAVAPGSLLKPFVAAAYGEQHNGLYPHFVCSGTADHCWYPHGHGEIGLEEALAQSCNSYFLHLAEDVDGIRACTTYTRFGMNPPTTLLAPADMIGLTSVWRETPMDMVRAYLALIGDRSNPSRDRIAAGMKAAAQHGTAKAAGIALASHDLLAKTGTASCLHRPQATADGFALLLYPSSVPRFLLLVRQHAATGAHTSGQAGAMLRAMGLGV
jgi:cell division protein FtsI/penicillin-binding protein 2